MFRKYRWLFALASCALVQSALVQAGDWYTLAVSDQALIVTDRSAMLKSARGGSVQEVQIFAHLREMAGAGAPVRRLDIALDIDCRRQRFRPAQFTARNEAGEILLAWDADPQQARWQAPEVGSANAFLVEAVCSRKFDPARMRAGADILQLQRLYVAASTGR